MRIPLGFMLAAVGAWAQAPRTVTLGLTSFGPTFTGRMEGLQDGQPISVDLEGDLGLAKDKAKVGFLFDYQGPRFGFMAQVGGTDYAGDKTTTRPVTLDGTTYAPGARITSHLKLTTVEGVWTLRILPMGVFWLGVDLGAEAWKVEMDATGTAVSPVPGTATAATSFTAPIPQLGLSAGSRAPGGFVEVKGFVHYLGAKGAKYTRTGLEARAYPLAWLGVRAFLESETFDVPQGSLQDDLMLKLDRKGAGFGVVVRF